MATWSESGPQECTSLTVPRGQNRVENVQMTTVAAEFWGEKAPRNGVTFLVCRCTPRDRQYAASAPARPARGPVMGVLVASRPSKQTRFMFDP